MGLGSGQLDPRHRHTRLRRPDGIVEGTRWLMAGLALVSLLLVALVAVPAAVSSGHVRLPPLALGAAAVLAFSNVDVYRRGRTSIGLDVLDAVAIAVLALACPEPSVAFGYVFAALWFRGLYGSTRQSLIRCGLYVVAMASTVRLWPLLPEHTESPAVATVLGVFPTMFLTVVVARRLGSALLAREQALRRDAVVTALGAALLGVTDPAVIREMGWAASLEICAATPALRLLAVTRDGTVLRVAGAGGDFAAVPPNLPDDVLLAAAVTGTDTVPDVSMLDSAARASLTWTCVPISHQQDSWLLVGVPAKSPDEVLLALRGLANQVIMALRNSEVHQDLTFSAGSTR